VTRISDIEAHIGNMGELLDIVGAMRSLASMRVQEAHHALPGIRRYAEMMAGAIAAALLLMPESHSESGAGRGRRALVLCTAEHGFVGGFNERIFEAAEKLCEPDDMLFVLGSRGAALAQERGRPALWSHPMATRPDGVPETVRKLAADLYARIARARIIRVEAIFARHRQGAPPAIELRALLPVDFSSFATARPVLPPLHNLPAEILLEKLIADYVFALLTETAVESLASENAARFATMESAHDNILKKLEELRHEARHARQDEITAELLDLVTGAEALRRTSHPPLTSGGR
jgi:F-type H+-transporting ATPase subunit gamma